MVVGNPKQFKMGGRRFAKWLPLILIQVILWITYFLFWTTNHSRDWTSPDLVDTKNRRV